MSDSPFSTTWPSALPSEALIQYQWISLMPGGSKNFRFLIMQDGRLFYAGNKPKQPVDHNQPFNTPLPHKPVRTLPAEMMTAIEQKLAEVDFFAQPEHQESPARDGSLAIVTAQQDGRVHEVKYHNVDNALTDFLHSITPEEPEERSPEEELAHLETLLREMEAQNKKLSGN